jgi:Cu2+-exporting ATPase
VAVPLAATGALNPLFAAAAMAASSLLVVGNSARPLEGGRFRALLSRRPTTPAPDAGLDRSDGGAR